MKASILPEISESQEDFLLKGAVQLHLVIMESGRQRPLRPVALHVCSS
jgi:hypothetical protein